MLAHHTKRYNLRQAHRQGKPVRPAPAVTEWQSAVRQSDVVAARFHQLLNDILQTERSESSACAQIEPALVAYADALRVGKRPRAAALKQHLKTCARCRDKLRFLSEADLEPQSAAEMPAVTPPAFLRRDQNKSWSVLPRSQLDGYRRGLLVHLSPQLILNRLSQEPMLLVRGESSDSGLLMTETTSVQDESWMITLSAAPSAQNPQCVTLCAEVICDEPRSIRLRLRWADQTLTKIMDEAGQACFENLRLALVEPSTNIVLEAEVIEDSHISDERSNLIQFPAAPTRARRAGQAQHARASRSTTRAA